MDHRPQISVLEVPIGDLIEGAVEQANDGREDEADQVRDLDHRPRIAVLDVLVENVVEGADEQAKDGKNTTHTQPLYFLQKM